MGDEGNEENERWTALFRSNMVGGSTLFFFFSFLFFLFFLKLFLIVREKCIFNPIVLELLQIAV
jgi:hypothetical protein